MPNCRSVVCSPQFPIAVFITHLPCANWIWYSHQPLKVTESPSVWSQKSKRFPHAVHKQVPDGADDDNDDVAIHEGTAQNVEIIQSNDLTQTLTAAHVQLSQEQQVIIRENWNIYEW